MSDVKIGMYLFLVFWDRQACFQLMMKCSMSFAVFAAAQQLRSRSCVSPSPDPDILQCDGCKAGCDPAFYCDGECRRLDWKRHKNECQIHAANHYVHVLMIRYIEGLKLYDNTV